MQAKNPKTVKNQKSEIQKILTAEISKSQKIKSLFDLGLTTKTISELLSIRYQFAYNVISNYVNINEIPVIDEEKISKKSQVIQLFLEGNTNITISKLLKTNYNYVYKIIKEYGLQLKQESK